MKANENADHSLPPTVEKIPDLDSSVGSDAPVGDGVNKVAPMGLLCPVFSTLIPQLSQNLESCRRFLPHSLQNIIALLIACEANYSTSVFLEANLGFFQPHLIPHHTDTTRVKTISGIRTVGSNKDINIGFHIRSKTNCVRKDATKKMTADMIQVRINLIITPISALYITCEELSLYPTSIGNILRRFRILECGTKSVIKIGNKVFWMFQTN